MYRVAGSNLFGQWLEEDRIISDFRDISRNPKTNDFDINGARLIHMSWSYNVFMNENKFFIIGDWNGKANELHQVDLPEECDTSEFESNLSMVGNDYYLLLANKKQNTVWVIDLQQENSFKKVNLNTELPEDTNAVKRPRWDSEILKIAITNNSCLYLTTDGRVYSGILPSLVDTSHCTGKVCDVRCGYEHFMLLTDAGRVYTWGNGRRLQLGHGSLDNFDIPTEIEALAGIKITKIRAGGWHCMTLSEFGDLYTWGWNDTGQLGVRDLDAKGVLNREGLKSYPLPTLVDILDEDGKEVDMNVIDIDCGSRHTALMLEDYSVWTTGSNKYGQVGFSPEQRSSVDYFKKTFQCERENNISIHCGHWSTVLIMD